MKLERRSLLAPSLVAEIALAQTLSNLEVFQPGPLLCLDHCPLLILKSHPVLRALPLKWNFVELQRIEK